jgi:hypothetical protein
LAKPTFSPLAFLWLSLLSAAALLAGCKEQQLTGYYERDAFIDTCAWKEPVGFHNKVDYVYLDSIVHYADSFDVTIVVGTWCNTSEKWVPHFLAHQRRGYLPMRGLTIISVDTSKVDSLGFTTAHDVDSVPTFLFYDNGVLIGRLNDKPMKTGWFRRNFEGHMWMIFRRNDHLIAEPREISLGRYRN